MLNIYDLNEHALNRISVCGDIHGQFKTFNYCVERMSEYDSDMCYIVAGDCGFGFNKQQYYMDVLKKFNEECKDNNIFIFFVRGNHDDRKYFDENIINFSNIKTVKDYSIITYKGHNILCVGGGISIDRTYRLKEELRLNRYLPSGFEKKKLYWEDEAPNYDEEILNEIKERRINITDIVTHTAPSFCPPTDKSGIRTWMLLDQALEQDLFNERDCMDKLFDYSKKNFKLEKWFYGHFHSLQNDEEYKNTIQGVRFVLCPDLYNNNLETYDIFDSDRDEVKTFKYDGIGEIAVGGN